MAALKAHKDAMAPAQAAQPQPTVFQLRAQAVSGPPVPCTAPLLTLLHRHASEPGHVTPAPSLPATPGLRGAHVLGAAQKVLRAASQRTCCFALH